MASITQHRNKKTGAVYVYSVESYWDKEMKAPRNKQTCLGRLDPETGEAIPSKRRRKIADRAASAPGVTVTSRVAADRSVPRGAGAAVRPYSSCLLAVRLDAAIEAAGRHGGRSQRDSGGLPPR